MDKDKDKDKDKNQDQEKDKERQRWLAQQVAEKKERLEQYQKMMDLKHQRMLEAKDKKDKEDEQRVAQAQPITPPGLIMDNVPQAMLAAVQEVAGSQAMASTGFTQAQYVEAIQKQHDAIMVQNLLREKDLQILELQKIEQLYREEKRKQEQQERETRLSNSPWQKAWAQKMKEHQEKLALYTQKLMDGPSEEEEDINQKKWKKREEEDEKTKNDKDTPEDGTEEAEEGPKEPKEGAIEGVPEDGNKEPEEGPQEPKEGTIEGVPEEGPKEEVEVFHKDQQEKKSDDEKKEVPRKKICYKKDLSGGPDAV
jgi:hypothetical protein